VIPGKSIGAMDLSGGNVVTPDAEPTGNVATPNPALSADFVPTTEAEMAANWCRRGQQVDAARCVTAPIGLDPATS
jgi:hypothetical protein